MLERKIILQTERLYLHEMTVDEAPDFYGLNSDPEVVRYTGDPPFESLEATQDFIASYNHYRDHGMGRWVVRLKSDDTYLGWCGLKRHEDNEIDIGFRFHQRFWNRGYATESAAASLRYGFETFEPPYIIGRVMHENLASIRVLEKLGMRYWKDGPCDGHPSKYFRIDRPLES